MENENGNVQYDCVKSGMSHNYDSANEQPNLIIIKEPNVGIMYWSILIIQHQLDMNKVILWSPLWKWDVELDSVLQKNLRLTTKSMNAY